MHIDTREIEANIEHTRFPVPEHEQHSSTADCPGLLRAADLIGQLADINYLRKASALFAEFRETGLSEKLGYDGPDDLWAAYPAFFWKAVCPYIGDALRYLRVTQEGKQWIANLFVSWSFKVLDGNSVLNDLFNHGFVYWIYGVMSVLAATFVYLYVPETKRHTLEGIQSLWSRSGSTA